MVFQKALHLAFPTMMVGLTAYHLALMTTMALQKARHSVELIQKARLREYHLAGQTMTVGSRVHCLVGLTWTEH
jgi:hypothetical protein